MEILGNTPKYSRRTSTLCIVVIFVYLLATMRCWIGFGGRLQLMTYAFPVIMFLLYLIGKVHYAFKKRYVIFSVVIAVFSLITLYRLPNLFGFLNRIAPAVCILFVICIPDHEKEYVFSKVIKWFGILLVISMSIYLINMFIPLPGFGTIVADYGSKTTIAGNFTNYLFYIHPQFTLSDSTFKRFNGMFIEPGDVGCVSAFMLMATHFDFKRYKYLWAFLAALILSFSLAGYLLVLAAYLFKIACEDNKRVGSIMFFFIVVIGVYFWGLFYNEGNNIINQTILSRLQTDDDFGFTGNNRTSLLKIEYFFMMFNNTHTMLFGYDKDTLDMLYETGLGSGLINHALVIGMVGIFGLILPFLIFAFTSSSIKFARLFFLFFLLYFFQRTETTWVAIVMSYVYGIVIKERDQLKV